MTTPAIAPTIRPEDHHWSLFGKCSKVDPDVMFPGDKNLKGIDRAKVVCLGDGSRMTAPCPVLEQCRKERDSEPYGVIAGLTADERQDRRTKLARRRNGQTAA